MYCSHQPLSVFSTLEDRVSTLWSHGGYFVPSSIMDTLAFMDQDNLWCHPHFRAVGPVRRCLGCCCCSSRLMLGSCLVCLSETCLVRPFARGALLTGASLKVHKEGNVLLSSLCGDFNAGLPAFQQWPVSSGTLRRRPKGKSPKHVVGRSPPAWLPSSHHPPTCRTCCPLSFPAQWAVNLAGMALWCSFGPVSSGGMDQMGNHHAAQETSTARVMPHMRQRGNVLTAGEVPNPPGGSNRRSTLEQHRGRAGQREVETSISLLNGRRTVLGP